MKKIIKLIFLSLFLISVSSCDNEDMDLLAVSPNGTGEITAPENGFKQVLNPEEEQTNIAFTLTWNAADYGVPTEITYKIEFAQGGTDFESPIEAGKTTNTAASWSISEFNGLVVTAGLSPFIEGEMDIRVTSSIGSEETSPQTSGMITVFITPFTTDLPKISVPGNHQGWDPATAPLLAASEFGETNYEGYVWLDGGYKFTGPNDQGNFTWDVNWGDDGTYTGVLLSNSSDNCNEDVASYFLVKADTEALTYSTFETKWGLIGSATPGGWDNDTDMTYDPDTKTMRVTLDLIVGEIKFRANDAWDLNYGDTGADGMLNEGGDNIQVTSGGNYTVVLDLSSPRDYTYRLIAN